MDPAGNMPDSVDPKHRGDATPSRTATDSPKWFGEGKHVDPKTPRETREGRR